MFSCLIIADIVVAELRKSMEPAIPWMIDFLSIYNPDSLRETGAKVLLNLSQEGSTSYFPA